jgi:hypothetical protein
MEFKMKKLTIIIAALSAFILTSCMSLQHDVSLPVEQTGAGDFSVEMESRLAVFDAAMLMGDSPEKDRSSRTYVIEQIQVKLMEPQLDKTAVARFTAVQGRLYLLGGERGQAEKCYRKAQKKNPEDSEVVVLGYRLGLIKKLGQNTGLYDSDGIFILEAAIDAYKNGLYDDAAGLFDMAFLKLPPFYRSSYKNIRDNAWNLKDSGGRDSKVTNLLQLNELTLSQMMEIAEDTGNILDMYTGGRKLSGQQLFAQITKEGLLKSVSGTTEDTPSGSVQLTAGTKATRILCARFLWNLYVSMKGDETTATAYSRTYRASVKARSPVPDVPLDSEDFDAVLGTVENELLALPDGRNFHPEETVSGVGFSRSIKKLQ